MCANVYILLCYPLLITEIKFELYVYDAYVTTD